MDKQQAIKRYLRIVHWLYKNDGNFSSKNQWREAFLDKLKRELGIEDEDLK